MWPSFSLWACRILKMRSCLRMPLAPGRSRARAILVSSVMFFSLSSAIVIFTYGIFWGWISWIFLFREVTPAIQEREFFHLGPVPRSRQPDWPGGDSGSSIMQPDAVVRQLLAGIRQAPPRPRQPCPPEAERRSWCPECGLSAGETYAWPWRQPGTKDNGC